MINQKAWFTRPDKENDRVRHIETVGAHLGPVFLSYRGIATIDDLIRRVTSAQPTVSFTANDDIQHELWAVSDPQLVDDITTAFVDVDAFYIADGHHRAAAAARIGDGHDDESAVHHSWWLQPDHALKILHTTELFIILVNAIAMHSWKLFPRFST